MKQNSNTLSFLRPDLADKIIGLSSIEEFPQGTEILKENQYIKTLPILIDGLIKVYAKFDDKELLLYYIEKSQSCIMTFYASLKNTPSKVTAVTEEDSKAILLPISHLPDLIKDFPEFNELFYNQFNLRYVELIERLGHLLLDNMDKRLFDHLKKKLELTKSTSIVISHNQLAKELGTAREVVSRTLKKLENADKITQNSGEIKIVGEW